MEGHNSSKTLKLQITDIISVYQQKVKSFNKVITVNLSWSSLCKNSNNMREFKFTSLSYLFLNMISLCFPSLAALYIQRKHKYRRYTTIETRGTNCK